MQIRFYVRAQGHVSGPYEFSTLRQMAANGTLARTSMISDDQANWAAAGDYEDLFPPSGGGATAAGEVFYYSLNGVTQNPVSMETLGSLVAGGTLQGTDLVWRAGAQFATPVAKVQQLAPLLGSPEPEPAPWPAGQAAPQMQAGTLSYEQPAENDPREARRHLDAIGGRSAVLGVISGALMLLLLNLPFGKFGGDDYKFWWDIFKEPEAPGTIKALCIYFLVAGLGLCIIGGAGRGLGRAIPQIILSAVGLIILIIPILEIRIENVAMVLVMILLYLVLTAGLIGTSDFKSRLPGSTGGTIAHAIFGGLIVLMAIVMVIMFLSNLKDMPIVGNPGGSRRRGRSNEEQAAETLGIVCGIMIVVGALCAIVAGICSLIATGIRTRGIARTSFILAVIAFLSLGVTLLIAFFGSWMQQLSQLEKRAAGGGYYGGMSEDTKTRIRGRIATEALMGIRLVVLIYTIFVPLIGAMAEVLGAPIFGPAARKAIHRGGGSRYGTA